MDYKKKYLKYKKKYLEAQKIYGGSEGNLGPDRRTKRRDDRLNQYKQPYEKELNNMQLIKAVQEQNIKIVSELLEKGANINHKDKDGYTALLHAVKIEASNLDYLAVTRKEEIIQELLNRGAKIDDKDEEGNTVLMIVIEDGYKNIAQDLINKGADLDTQNDDGNTAFTIAAAKNYEGIMRSIVKKNILDNGRDINDQDDENGNTQLMTSIALLAEEENNKYNETMALVLIEMGANLTIKNNLEMTAFIFAENINNETIKRAILDKIKEEYKDEDEEVVVTKAKGFWGRLRDPQINI